MPIITRLSNNADDLLRKLYQTPNVIDRTLFRRVDNIELIREIGENAEVAVISHLLSYAIKNKSDNGIEVAKIIHNLINQLSVLDLSKLDESIRGRGFIWGWNLIQPNDVINLDHLGEYKLPVLGVCSFHENGFVREHAVSALGKVTTGRELPFLLIRLNDWVPNVQNAAFSAINTRLVPEYASGFVECLPLITHLYKRQRIIQSPLVSSVTKLLQDEVSRPALISGLHSTNRYIRRACFKVAYDTPGIEIAKIIQFGSKDPDTQIRLLSVQKVWTVTDMRTVTHLLRMFENDTFMPVRREAYRIKVEVMPESASATLRKALLDFNPTIRSEARNLLSKRETLDFPAYYKNSLKLDATLYSAISGLGEVGKPSDEIFFLSYLNHTRSRIRFASVKALARINPNGFGETFFQLLFDPSPRVSREAAKALIERGYSMNGERLLSQLDSTTKSHVRKNILTLIARLSKWESIYYLLKTEVSFDEELALLAKQLVGKWETHFNSSFISPTKPQKDRLIKLLEESENILDENVLRQITFVMKVLS